MYKLIDNDRLCIFKNTVLSIFNGREPQEIGLLNGGSPSKTYRFLIEDKIYVARLMDLEELAISRQNQVQCLQAAAQLDVAPKCYYADAEAGIVIMEYIENKSIDVTKEWLCEVADLLRKLHTYNNFPPPHQPLFSYINGLVKSLRALPLNSLLIDYFKNFDEIVSILSPHLIMSPCHNDLNCKNVLFNGKTYFIDWEAAGMEDPFFDVATICNEFIFNEPQEHYFLQQYFGREPNLKEQAKILLMKQVSYCYLAIHYLQHAVNGGLTLVDEKIMDKMPTAREWSLGYKSGKYQQINPDDFLLYALVQIKESLAQMATKQFNEAKAVLKPPTFF